LIVALKALQLAAPQTATTAPPAPTPVRAPAPVRQQSRASNH
jgi:hypothetical protein